MLHFVASYKYKKKRGGGRKKSEGNIKARFLWGGKCRMENSS